MVIQTKNKRGKLAIVTSHPIQYHAPLFQLLSLRGEIEIKVFYTWSQTQTGRVYDPGFNRKVAWDLPLLENYTYEFVENIAKDPGTHHFMGLNNPGLRHAIEAWEPHAVWVFTWALKSHLQSMRYFHKKLPVLFRGDSTLLNEQTGWKKILRTLYLKWVYRSVDYALYVGTNNKNYYLKHGLREEQLVHAPHAIDINRFLQNSDQHKIEAKKWRKELGIKEEEIVFLYAGKLEPVKNPELLLKAFLLLANENAQLVIVGNGVLERHLKAISNGAPQVHFLDFQNQTRMPVVYHLADVYVLPSKSETWGLAINEAMACEKPILASSKCGAAIDLIDEGQNGYIFESENVDDLQRKINLLLRSKDQLPKMGAYSLQKIQDFSYQKICEQLELLMEKIQQAREI